MRLLAKGVLALGIFGAAGGLGIGLNSHDAEAKFVCYWWEGSIYCEDVVVVTAPDPAGPNGCF